MANDDLLRILDLEGKDGPQTNAPLPITTAGEGKKTKPTSPTALRLDDWGLRRGEDVLRESERLQQCLATIEGQEQQAHSVADFHGAAFEVDPQLNEGCTDPLRRNFIQQLLETPECHELRPSTVLNDTVSEIAATAFAGQYTALRKERDKDEKKQPGKEGGSGHDFGAEISVLKHVSKALAEASKEVEEAKEAAAALAWGQARQEATTPGPSPRSSSGCVRTPRSAGFVSWRAATDAWPSRSSGARPRMAWTTWSATANALQ